MSIPFRHFYRMVFFLAFILTLGGEAIAQSPNFPVRASVTIVNSSPYLEDYGRDGNLLVVLTLVDNQPNYQGLLRFTIEGNGYRAETRDIVAQAPISLGFGAPVILRGPDLAPYFDLNNLNVEGIATDNTLGNGGALPDGPITICVEVYDVNRFTDPPVSNPACAIRFVQQNYPPELVRPLGQLELPATQTSPAQGLGLGRDGPIASSVSVLNFSWNPRHVPQPADDEYIMEVWKKVPGLTTDQIIRSEGRSRQPIITRVPRYTYTNFDSRLEIGAEYIWRVQVRDRRGVRQFVNDGFSRPGEFTYGTIPPEVIECLGAEALFVTNVTDTEATISWENPSATTSNGYQISYRSVGQGNWIEAGIAPITATNFAFSGLAFETAYEARVCASCKSGTPVCASIPFTTMEEELIDCGPLPDPTTFAITNNSLRVVWDNIPQAASYVLTWKKLPNPGEPVQTQQQNIRTATDGAPADGEGNGNNNGPIANPFLLELPAGTTEAITNSNLQAGYTYRLKLCKICLDGREECTEWEVPFAGYVDYCSEDVQPNIAVVSGSETQNNMDLGWTYSGMNVLPEGYDLRLVYHPTADPSAPDTTNLAGTMTGTTVTGLSVGTDYTFEVCVICPDDEERCATTTGTTDPFSCPDPMELEAAVIVSPVIPDGIMVDWSELGPATDPAGWSFALLNMTGDTLQRATAETGYQTIFTDLDAETEYRVSICHQCPVAGEPQCTEETIFLPGCEAAELNLTEGTVHFDFVELNWTDVGAEEYTVTFSEQGGTPLADPQKTENTEFRLGGLSPTTTYEISVCFDCGIDPVCDTIIVSTIGVNCALAGDYEYDFECGINVSLLNPENQQLVETLNPGDSIWAGDFLVEIAEITGNTTFGGYGRTKIPYLKNAKLRLDFHEIQVNENCRLVAGKMVIKSPLEAALEQLQQGLQDLQDILGEIDGFLGSISSTLGSISTALDQIATAADVTAEANAVLDQLVSALDQVPYLPDSYVDAVEDAADCLKQAAISGDDEAVRNCRDQLQEAIQNAQDYIDDLFDADFIVDFAPTVPATSYWGLDSQRYDLVTEGYDQRTIGGTPYKVPWASTSTEEPSGVPFGAVRRDNGTLQPVNFIGSDTQPYPGWTKNGTSASNPGLYADGDQEIKVVFAAHDNPDAEAGNDSIPPVKLAGQLNLVTYTPVRHTVHIIPINNAALPQDAGQVEEALNRIYRPAVAEWTVAIEPNINVDEFAGTLQDIPNSLLSNYTPQMISLRNAVKDQSYYDGEHYYLLVVPRMAEPDRLGFMPRKRSFGFLSAERLTDGTVFNRTIAHELGHGTFHLQHIFDRFEGLTAGSTDNLMDSGDGETLFKYQWDNVHDPESNFTLFDEEEEGESVAVLPCPILTHDNASYGTYLTPIDNAIQLSGEPTNARLSFYNKEEDNYKRGRLKSIQETSANYHAAFLPATVGQPFLGYKLNGVGDTYTSSAPNAFNNERFFQVEIKSVGGSCNCVYYERRGFPALSNTGVSEDSNPFLPNPTWPGESPSNSPGNAINELLKTEYREISASFCGQSETTDEDETISIEGAALVGSKSGTVSSVEGFLSNVTNPSLDNTTKGCFYYHDQVNNTLKLYKSGSNQILEYQENEIQSTLDNACSLAEDDCEGVVVIIQRIAESNFKISSCYSDEFLTTGQAYQDLEGHASYTKEDARNQINGILKDKLEDMGSLDELAQEQHTDSGGEDGSLIVKEAGFFVWVGAAADELGHILKNIEVDTNTWNPAAADYQGKILVIWAPVAGVGDQLMMEVKDMKDMIGAAGEFIKKPKETVTGIYTTVTSLSADDVVKMVSDAAKAEIQTLTTPGPKRQHRVGELSTQAAATVFNWTKGVGKAGLELTQELGQNSDAMMPFLRRLDLDLGERFRKLSPDKKKMFKDDFEGLPDADLQKFIDNPDLIDGWEEMADFNFPSNSKVGHDIRLDLEFLEKYAALDAPRKTKMKDYLGNQVGAAGKKGHVNYPITKNMDMGDGVLRDYTITYDKHGFPKFESLCKELTDNAGNQRRVMFSADDLVGTVGDDLQRATTWAKSNFPAGSVKKISSTKISIKINGQWVPHTWHHHQNGKGLMAIPSKVHNVGQGGFGHSGGNALLGDPPIRGFFPDPDFSNP